MATMHFLRSAFVATCILASTYADTPIWSEPTGSAPAPRFEHSADRIGNALYVFGGTLSNDVREADLHILNMDTMRWSKPSTTGPAPLPTFGHSTTVASDQLYVMFGSNGRSMTNRVYQLDTDNLQWSRVQTHGRVPTPRAYATTVTVDGVVHTFGGFDGVGYLNDLHRWKVYDPATNATGVWEKLNAHGAVPEVRAAAAAATHGRFMFMFGGFEVGIYKQDFFKLNLDTLEWSRVHLTMGSACPMPGPRAMASLTLVGTNLMLYGGVFCQTVPGSWEGKCTSLGDLHIYDLRRSSFEGSGCHSETGVTADAPPPRYGHTATLFGSKVVTFGGANWPNLFNDVAQYDVYDRAWTLLPGRPPYARKQHSMNMAQLGGKPHLVVFGGKQGIHPGHSSSVHTFSLEDARWEHPEKAGGASVAPQGLSHHAATVADESTLLVFGGYDGTRSSAAVWACDLDKQANGGRIVWRPIEGEGAIPSARHGHTIVELDDPLKGSKYTWMLWGGVDCSGGGGGGGGAGNCTFFNSLHTVTADSLDGPFTYEAILANSGSFPSKRASHSWTSVGQGRHVLYGGIGPNFSNKADMWVFDESSMQFTPVTLSVGIDASRLNLEGRFGHTAVAYRNDIVVFAGATCQGVADCIYHSNVMRIDPSTGLVSNIEVRGGSAPAGRVGAAAVQLGEVMYAFGGAMDDKVFGELLTVEPDAAVSKESIVFGEGATGGMAGKNTRFYVQLVDSFGENRTTGGDKVEVVVVAAEKKVQQRIRAQGGGVPLSVTDMLSGGYRVDFFTNVSAWYNVSISVNGAPFPPFQTYIAAGEPVAEISKLSGNALRGCIAGENCTVVVELYDDLGNRLDRVVPLDPQMVIDPSVEIPTKVYRRPKKVINDTGTGRIEITYRAETAGEYHLTVKMRRALVANRTFDPIVEPAQGSNELTEVIGDALEGFRAGDQATVTVVVRDAFNNPVGRGGDAVEATFVGRPAGANEPPTATVGVEVPVEVTDNADGTYTLTWTATVAGPYTLSATMNGAPLERCAGTYVPVSPSPVSAATTFAYGAGVRFATAGYRAFFTIQAADEFGNNVTEGGETFNVLYSGQSDKAKDQATVIDHKDGTYTVSYLTTLAGDYMLSATLKRGGQFQSIHNSPFLGTCAAAGADPDKSLVYVETVDRPIQYKQFFKVVMGVHNYFKIQAVDRYGNNKTRGNDKFTAEVQGPVSMQSFISDLGDGTYIGTYVAPKPGQYKLKIYYGDKPVKFTPIAIFARENFDACPKGCSGNGECHNRECICHAGFTGSDCSIKTIDCPGDCMGSGVCLDAKCYCYPGFTGISCESQSAVCPNDCSNKGVCRDGICVCEPGFAGTDCSDNRALCPSRCMGNGECVVDQTGKAYECSCYPGYEGRDCSIQRKFCPKGCNQNGNCMSAGVCQCFPGWTGLDCATRQDAKATLWADEKSTFFNKAEGETVTQPNGTKAAPGAAAAAALEPQAAIQTGSAGAAAAEALDMASVNALAMKAVEEETTRRLTAASAARASGQKKLGGGRGGGELGAPAIGGRVTESYRRQARGGA